MALWIAWPKKTSAQAADFTQQMVRETGLATGLVDYKICSILFGLDVWYNFDREVIVEKWSLCRIRVKDRSPETPGNH